MLQTLGYIRKLSRRWVDLAVYTFTLSDSSPLLAHSENLDLRVCKFTVQIHLDLFASRCNTVRQSTSIDLNDGPLNPLQKVAEKFSAMSAMS